MSKQRPQTPAIGSPVHFVHGDKHVPAIVIDPERNDAGHITQALWVMTATHGAFVTFADEDAAGAPATWHWPETA